MTPADEAARTALPRCLGRLATLHLPEALLLHDFPADRQISNAIYPPSLPFFSFAPFSGSAHPTLPPATTSASTVPHASFQPCTPSPTHTPPRPNRSPVSLQPDRIAASSGTPHPWRTATSSRRSPAYGHPRGRSTATRAVVGGGQAVGRPPVGHGRSSWGGRARGRARGVGRVREEGRGKLVLSTARGGAVEGSGQSGSEGKGGCRPVAATFPGNGLLTMDVEHLCRLG